MQGNRSGSHKEDAIEQLVLEPVIGNASRSSTRPSVTHAASPSCWPWCLLAVITSASCRAESATGGVYHRAMG